MDTPDSTPIPGVEKPFWHSKKWWMAMIGFVVPLLNSFLGWDLKADQVSTIILPLIAYVIGQGIADFGKNRK